MSYIAKPKVHHPALKPNAIGLTRRDYEGAITTLCAGCGHDSITAAIIQAFWELDIEPYKVAKLSGIGCSSKTPAYFLREAHGFNSVHGRMPSISTGAGAANGDLIMIGVSGDGDSLSIGLGQLSHAIRRNVKEQLVPILKAGLKHSGFAFIDVISPCVTFNDHEGSTKAYAYTREHQIPIVQADYVPHRDEITTAYDPGAVQTVTLHDGSSVNLRKIAEDYDPTDRDRAYSFIRDHQARGEVCTGLLYIDPTSSDMMEQNDVVPAPLYNLPYENLCPGSAELEKLQARYR